MIELSEVISQLRTELDVARRASETEELRFELGPVEVEVSVALQREGGVGAKVRFWVVELGANGKAATTATQRITLTLNPRLASHDRSATSGAESGAVSPVTVYVGGQSVTGER